MLSNSEPLRCPQCDTVLQVLLFLGFQPDGYVCKVCKLHYSDDLKPLAHVIGEEEEDDTESMP